MDIIRDIISFLLTTIFIYLFPLLILWGLGSSFTHKKPQPKLWKLSYAILPFFVWFIFILFYSDNKSLANGFLEPFIIGALEGTGMLLSSIYCEKKNIDKKILYKNVTLLVMVVSIGIAILFPELEE